MRQPGPHQYLRRGFNYNMLPTFLMIGYGNTHEQVKLIVKAMENMCIDDMVQTNNFTQL